MRVSLVVTFLTAIIRPLFLRLIIDWLELSVCFAHS